MSRRGLLAILTVAGAFALAVALLVSRSSGGDSNALSQVWRDYGIYPGMSHATPEGTSMPDLGGGEGHTDGLHVIDPEGRERAFLRSSATPQDIAGNLVSLLG